MCLSTRSRTRSARLCCVFLQMRRSARIPHSDRERDAQPCAEHESPTWVSKCRSGLRHPTARSVAGLSREHRVAALLRLTFGPFGRKRSHQRMRDVAQGSPRDHERRRPCTPSGRSLIEAPMTRFGTEHERQADLGTGAMTWSVVDKG